MGKEKKYLAIKIKWIYVLKLLFHADDDDDEQTADPDGSGLGFRRIGTAIGWFSCLSLLLSLS